MKSTLATFTGLVLALMALPAANASPTEVTAASANAKRQTEPLPSKINIGLKSNDEGKDNDRWVAWTNGVDPCSSNSGTFGPNGNENPCGYRFAVPEFAQQLTFQGCGGDDLWLTENGGPRVATCYYTPGNQYCSTSTPYYVGQWQCVPDS